MTSVRKSYTFQSLLKSIILLPAEKFGNINLSQQTVLLKLIYDYKNFWFQKNSIQICIFNCNNVFLWDCLGKGACIKRMIAVRNYSTNTIMEKQTEEEGGELRIWNFQGWSKKLENFSGIAHLVLISLGHFELHFWLCQPQTRKTTVV